MVSEDARETCLREHVRDLVRVALERDVDDRGTGKRGRSLSLIKGNRKTRTNPLRAFKTGTSWATLSSIDLACLMWM